MRVLVTGGTGLIGVPTVRHLLEAGHQVRLLARNAERDAARWPDSVETHDGTVANPHEVAGAAEHCDAVIHIAGVGAESPPDATFQRINVDGTRHLLAEASRAGAGRFVFVSSLGVDEGRSDYHASKRAAEALVRAWPGAWVIGRPGNVYGPGDEVISLLFHMVRALPAVPVIEGGDARFQPIWADDLGRALARAAEREGLAGRTLSFTGPDVTTMDDIEHRIGTLTSRSPMRIPIPAWLAEYGLKVAESLGVDLPVSHEQIIMLQEHIVLPPGEPDGLAELDLTPTSLDDGLRALADEMPEQLPSEGSGALWRRRYYADIAGSRHSAESLFALVRDDFPSLLPDALVRCGAEGQTGGLLQLGTTITMALPLRGNVQVRVDEIGGRGMTLVTMDGHPLAGAIRFLSEERGPALRFAVESHDRAASVFDRIAMRAGAAMMKRATWTTMVGRVVERSGGRSENGVQIEEERLPAEQAARIEDWVRELVAARQRVQAPVPPGW